MTKTQGERICQGNSYHIFVFVSENDWVFFKIVRGKHIYTFYRNVSECCTNPAVSKYARLSEIILVVSVVRCIFMLHNEFKCCIALQHMLWLWNTKVPLSIYNPLSWSFIGFSLISFPMHPGGRYPTSLEFSFFKCRFYPL